jgi:hypothetical protein
VADGFLVRRALASALAGPPPVIHGLVGEAGLGVVIRQQLGLSLDHLGKPLLQHLGNVLMVLLPGALQQRLIGGCLDQGVLEEIRRQRRQPPLVQKLGFDQLL